MSLADCIQTLDHRNPTHELVLLDLQTAHTVMVRAHKLKYRNQRPIFLANLKSTSSCSLHDKNSQSNAQEIVKSYSP